MRRFRLDADLTQARVAEIMGVDRAYISALERGERNPTVLSLFEVAQALDIHIARFFDESVLVSSDDTIKKRASKAVGGSSD